VVNAQVVVIGGGFAGATCARSLRLLDPNLRIVLIEPNRTYSACPFSNLVLVGKREMAEQQFSYAALEKLGITVIAQSATAVDTDSQFVMLADGSKVEYQSLVVAPGIDIAWGTLSGYDQSAAQRMPHAWKAGPQTELLKRQISAMPDDGLLIISAPANPFRCPPGPYERASLIAHFFKQYKPRAKVLLLDGKDQFSKQALFQSAWAELYADQLEWRGLSDGAAVVAVDAKSNTVSTDFDTFTADVVNIIPPQQAGRIAQQAGLADASGWCPIKPASFASTQANNVHVIGDAAIANAMPKSAFAANAQAKLCAMQVVRLLQEQPLLSSKLINTCYSLVAPDYGISVADVFRPGEQSWVEIEGAGGVSNADAQASERALEATYARSWFETITQEVFAL
jgi:NADPH-dependent 2,4-dienoyl-CoA reductase/sulfur reductase-like enzyme